MNIELPFPPSVNHYWLTARNGQRYIGDEGRKFRAETILAVRQANVKPFDGRLAVFVAVYPPDNRRRDLDNMLKAILDSLQHAGVYADDNQIDDLRIVRCDNIEDGAIIVTVEKIIENDG